VEQVLGRLTELGLPAGSLSARSLAAVGPATAARLSNALRPPDLTAAEATGEGLARALAGEVRGRRVLLPRPAEGRPELLEGLTAAGAEVLVVEAYRTLPAPAERLRVLAGWIERGEVDAVTFASPSAVRAVAVALGREAPLLSRALLAAIGPTTAAALREAGLPAGIVAGRPTGAELADAVAAALGPR
jgi:uroporphyrinogen-III synthase/uroporphyrinogen III methyltransferase/synthase